MRPNGSLHTDPDSRCDARPEIGPPWAAAQPLQLDARRSGGAQSLDSLATGTRVHITRQAPPAMIAGTLVRADSLRLVIMPDRDSSIMTISRSDLRRVDII